MLRTISALLLTFLVLSGYSQPGLTWEKAYGGSQGETGNSITQTSDGGIVVAGFNWSTDGDVAGHHGSVSEPDGWVLKLDANGDTIWTRSLGGTRAEYANMILETSDLGFIVAGQAKSIDGDVWDHHGQVWYYDVWLVKLDANGDTLWTKSYGGTDDEYAHAIDIDNSGGYMIGGTSKSTDGDVSGNNGDWDFWIIKTNSIGDTTWTRSFGGTSADYCEAIKATADGGCIAVGWSQSNDGDVVGAHGGNDLWVIKVDSSGNLEWQNALGGSSGDMGFAVELSADGNYIVGGSSSSSDGDVSGNHGNADFWIVKLSAIGDTMWTQSHGGSGDDYLESLQRTCDDGYIIVGQSKSDDGDVSGHHGSADSLDGWTVKIDAMGAINWEVSHGGTQPDALFGVTETDDGFIIATGYSFSSDGDVTTNNGQNDLWTVKMRTNANTPDICIVTVDSATNKNVVVWEDWVYPASSYNVYKETIVAGQYNLEANVPLDSLSIYIDQASNPDVVSNRYRISSVDSCGFESDTSGIHKTMHLNANLGINNDVVNLIWEDYEGLNFSTYIIYKGNSAATMDSVDAVPSTIFMYTDTIDFDTLDLFYAISLVHPAGGCLADKAKSYNSSKSNTSSVDGKTPMSLSITGTDATQGNCNGMAVANISGGIPPYVYLWDDSLAQATQTASNLCPGNYMVIVVDDLGDTLTATVVISSTGGTSIADHNELSVSVYPNPNNGHFSIEYSNISYGEDILLIYNSLGQILVRELLFSNQGKVDLHEIGAGVYNLKLISGNQMISRNIVVH